MECKVSVPAVSVLFEVSQLAAFLHSGRPLCGSQDLCPSLEIAACKASVRGIRELLKVRGRTESLKESKPSIWLFALDSILSMNMKQRIISRYKSLAEYEWHTTTEHCPDTQLEDAPWAPPSTLASPWKHLKMKGNMLFKLWTTNLDSLKAMPHNFLKIKQSSAT